MTEAVWNMDGPVDVKLERLDDERQIEKARAVARALGGQERNG
jgi:hypothetical protein